MRFVLKSGNSLNTGVFKARQGCYYQIKKGLKLSVPVKKITIGEYLAKLQARAWLSSALSSSFSSALHWSGVQSA